ncbi:MAG: FHA domain-containing protein, partial [bacterium]
MPKLIIKKGDFVVNKLSIPDDLLAFTIGSEQGNDIVIADDSISYYHIQLEKQSDDYYVR